MRLHSIPSKSCISTDWRLLLLLTLPCCATSAPPQRATGPIAQAATPGIQRATLLELTAAADALVGQGRFDEAAEPLGEALGFARGLVATNPGATAAKDLVEVLFLCGDVALARKQLDDAAKFSTEGLALARQLEMSNPSLEASHFVFVGLSQLARVAEGSGQLEEAETKSQQALDLARKQLREGPVNSGTKHDLFVAMLRFGSLSARRGRDGEASTDLHDALALARELEEANPASAATKHDVFLSLSKLGDLAMARRRFDEAAPLYDAAAALARRVAETNPSALAEADLSAGLKNLKAVTAIREAPPLSRAQMQPTLYGLGVALVQRTPVHRLDLTADELSELIRGLKDALSGKPLPALMELYTQRVDQLISERSSAREQSQGAAFVAKEVNLAGAEQLSSGVVLVTLTAGTGESPRPTDTVRVKYRGTQVDGREFDSSEGATTHFEVSKLIPCFQEGVRKMKVGGKARFVCPPTQAFGEHGNKKVPGNATVVYEVELVKVIHPIAP